MNGEIMINFRQTAYSATKAKPVWKTDTKEKLLSCAKLRADDSIRKASLLRGDQWIAAITTDDLIAKEAKYHKTCYRDYTRVNYKVAKDYWANIDEPFEVMKDILFDLYDSPNVQEDEKTVLRAAHLSREETKAMEYVMPWPPQETELDEEKVILSHSLSLLLDKLLNPPLMSTLALVFVVWNRHLAKILSMLYPVGE